MNYLEKRRALFRRAPFGPLLLPCLLLLFVGACAPSATPTAAVPTLPPTTAPTATNAPTPRPSVTPLRTPVHPAIQTPSWFRDVVLYEIFVRSFYDSNGDGIGDLKGITQKLDYLKDLGVGAIWLTPIFASPSYHGYDISDYYKINPDFGTEADLVELVREAHQRHIRVFLDYVVNHTSNQHPFFKDAFNNPASKYSDWYVWDNPEHTRYETFAGVQEMPQLNHDNPDVQKYLIDVAKYWMTKTGGGDPKQGIDGLRCDYVLGVPHAFWKKLRSELKPLNPDLVLLGEVWTGMPDIAPYYNDEFDATFDFPLYGEIEGSNDRVGDSLLEGVKPFQFVDGDLIAEQVLFPQGAERVVFVNNHDTNRVMSEAGGDVGRAKLGALLLLTESGTPMVYYGEEIGMSGVKAPAPVYDETRREPMHWYSALTGSGMTTWRKPADRDTAGDGVSVEEQSGKPDSLLEYYRKLIALRKSFPALRTGTREGIALANAPLAYAYLRRDENAAFVVVLNAGSQPASLTLDLGTSSLPDGAYKAIDALSQKEFPMDGLQLHLTLAAASGQVLQLVSR